MVRLRRGSFRDRCGPGSLLICSPAGTGRTWSIEESRWRNSSQNQVALCECWYRRWNRVTVIGSPDGRVVETPENSACGRSGKGLVSVDSAIVSQCDCRGGSGAQAGGCRSSRAARKISVCACSVLGDARGPDRVPFGLARGWSICRMRSTRRAARPWMMAARRRKGLRRGGREDEQFRQEVARPDADIILDPKAMREGGIFRSPTDLEPTQQQFQRLRTLRELFGESGNLL